MIEPLPEGHTHTCDKVRDGGGWSRDITNTTTRCGKPAVVVDRNTCNCGQCDMSCHLCEHHARRSGTDAERHEDHNNWLDAQVQFIAAHPESDNKARMLRRIEEMRKEGPVNLRSTVN